MDESQFVMVSDWMENGNIVEFISSHEDVDRFELVGFFSHWWSPFTDNPVIAQGCRKRADIYARSGDGTRRPERGMYLNAGRSLAH